MDTKPSSYVSSPYSNHLFLPSPYVGHLDVPPQTLKHQALRPRRRTHNPYSGAAKFRDSVDFANRMTDALQQTVKAVALVERPWMSVLVCRGGAAS